MKNAKMIDIILKERDNRNSRHDWTWESYYQKFTRTEKLLDEVEKHIKSRHCIQEARKQCVTSHVTAIEVYFKDTLLFLLKTFGNDKITEHIKIKFGIDEMERIIKEKISINEVIASYFNFQELGQIDKAFSTILDTSFFEELKSREFYISKNVSTFKIHKNFYKEINSFINLRHDFIHDINFNKNITKTQLDRYIYISSSFIMGADILINEKIDEYKKIKRKAKAQ